MYQIKGEWCGESMMCEGVCERRAPHALCAPRVRVARAYIPW